MIRLLFLTIFIGSLCLGCPIHAQECNIHFTGRVLDRATKEPLEFSAIALQESNDYILADSVGFFSKDSLCAGSYHVQVFHLGCAPAQHFITLEKDSSFIFYLEHHGELLKEVVVEGTAQSFQEAATHQTISSSGIRNQSGSTLADITEKVAGVRALRNGSGISKPMIHGLYGNRVAVINNGLLQAGQQWGADHAPEIDPNAANKITVIKGSDAIEYGSQALGGALLVDAGPIQNDPHLHGYLGYSFATNGLAQTLTGMANKSVGKFGWRLTGTYKRAGDHHTPDYYLTNTGIEELNGSLQVIYHPSTTVQHQLYYSVFTTTLGIFSGSNISNLTDLEDALNRDEPFNINDYFSYQINAPKQKVEHHLLKYSGKKFINEHESIEWIVGSQYDHRREFDVRRGDRSDIPALDLKLLAQSMQVKYVNDHSRLRYKVGAQFTFLDNTNSYETGILPLIPDYLKGTSGLYALCHYPLGKFVLEAGARYDLQLLKAWPITLTLPREVVIQQHTYHDNAFSVGAVYRGNNDMESRVQLVAAKRSPEPNELYSNGLHQGVASIEEGNWLLTPETSVKTIFTQSFFLENIMRVEASIFSHVVDDFIYLQPSGELRLTIRGAYPVNTYTQNDAWIRGADVVFISDFSHHLEWNLKFSQVRGSTLITKSPLPLMPSAFVSSAVSWAFEDTPVFRGSRVSIEGAYTGRQNNWDSDVELVPPPDDYFLLGLKLSSEIKIKKQTVFVGISINNLLNVRYRDYLNRLRYYSDEQGFDGRVSLRYTL